MVTALLETCLVYLDRAEDKEQLRASAGSYAWAWQSHFRLEHDPGRVLGEDNRFRYRPCKGLLLRMENDADPVAVMQVLLAVRTTGQVLRISLAPGQETMWRWLDGEADLQAIIEDAEGVAGHLAAAGRYDRMRVSGSLCEAVRLPPIWPVWPSLTRRRWRMDVWNCVIICVNKPYRRRCTDMAI
jgi:hypothetical protein